MAPRHTTFGKRERDRVKRERAAAKQDRRERRKAESDDDSPDAPADVPPQEDVLTALQRLHERFDDGDIDFEEFEKQKATLIDRLAVD